MKRSKMNNTMKTASIRFFFLIFSFNSVMVQFLQHLEDELKTGAGNANHQRRKNNGNLRSDGKTKK